MDNGYSLQLFLLLSLLANLTSADDTPCLSRKEEGGYICLCNETYCDTVESPTLLPTGSYYHYMTSEDSPGFTKTIGQFDKSAGAKSRNYAISSDVYILVNASVQYQTFMGIGASFTGSSGFLLNSLSLGAQEKFVESYFGTTGLEYTFARVPIAAADFSLDMYTYDDVPGDVELKYFNLTKHDFLYKIPFIKMALAASKRGLNLLGTTWTAPSWMKTNNSTDPGYLRHQYQETWANYHLKFLEAYNDNGINFWAITQGNEVIIPLFFGSFFKMANTVMLPAQAAYWTRKYLGPILKESKFKNVKILTLDDERPYMLWWARHMFENKEVEQYIDGIALHWYLDSESSTPSLEEFHNRYPNKYLLYSESSINGFRNNPVNLGDWSRGVKYINNIFQNFNHWVVGYIDWNIALNEEGGPTGTTLKLALDAAVIINVTSGEFYKQPLFYVLGHFSKFISPGSKRVQVQIKQDSVGKVNEDNFSKSLEDLAHSMGLNVNNPTPPPQPPSPPPHGPTSTNSPFPTRKPEPPSNTVLALTTTNPDGSRTIIAYNPRSVPANLIVTDLERGTFNQTVQPNSLNTFIYW